jgi:hypothetical protein
VAYPSGDTFGSMITEVIDSLQGFGTSNDQVCTLTSALSTAGTTFQVDDTNDIGRGIIEIDGEIMYVASTDNGNVYLTPWGRGYKGTVKTTHNAGTPVWISPTWPRSIVGREVNNMVKALYPQLFAVGQTEFSASMSNTYQYEMPIDVERVLSVQWKWGGYPNYETVKAWELDYASNRTDYNTGKSIIIGDPIPAAARLTVTYAKSPSIMTNESDSFAATTGLPASTRDVVILGVAQRLIPWQDTARLPVQTVPTDMVDSLKPVGNAQSNAQYIRALYSARLLEEIRNQQSKYPTRAHKVR